MKHVLLLGGTGKLGRVLLRNLLARKYSVTVLVRNPKKVFSGSQIKSGMTDKRLTILTGDVTKKEDVEKSLEKIDIVISTLGHGFRTKYPIQKNALSVLLPLMEKKGIKRFITITGSGLLVKGDPHSLFATLAEKAIGVIDPYRLGDAAEQQKLVEKSTLEWTVVRTPIHNGSLVSRVTKVGFAQPPVWKTVSRVAIAAFMIECIEKNSYIREAPIIY